MVDLLDRILLSDDVVGEFYKNYNGEFKTWLDNILPEVEKCKALKQDNPWHIYNCLDHILHSVEKINEQTTSLDNPARRLLAYTMFLHDIGKPECFLRRYSKLYGREVDSFFNHNVASTKIADRVLDKFGFDKKDTSIIKALIYAHDIFMFIRLKDDGNKFHQVLDNKLLQQHVDKLSEYGDGKTLMKYLIWVGRADNLAQSPDMTASSLHLLDVMEQMLKNI